MTPRPSASASGPPATTLPSTADNSEKTPRLSSTAQSLGDNRKLGNQEKAMGNGVKVSVLSKIEKIAKREAKTEGTRDSNAGKSEEDSMLQTGMVPLLMLEVEDGRIKRRLADATFAEDAHDAALHAGYASVDVPDTQQTPNTSDEESDTETLQGEEILGHIETLPSVSNTILADSERRSTIWMPYEDTGHYIDIYDKFYFNKRRNEGLVITFHGEKIVMSRSHPMVVLYMMLVHKDSAPDCDAPNAEVPRDKLPALALYEDEEFTLPAFCSPLNLCRLRISPESIFRMMLAEFHNMAVPMDRALDEQIRFCKRQAAELPPRILHRGNIWKMQAKITIVAEQLYSDSSDSNESVTSGYLSNNLPAPSPPPTQEDLPELFFHPTPTVVPRDCDWFMPETAKKWEDASDLDKMTIAWMTPLVYVNLREAFVGKDNKSVIHYRTGRLVNQYRPDLHPKSKEEWDLLEAQRLRANTPEALAKIPRTFNRDHVHQEVRLCWANLEFATAVVEHIEESNKRQETVLHIYGEDFDAVTQLDGLKASDFKPVIDPNADIDTLAAFIEGTDVSAAKEGEPTLSKAQKKRLREKKKKQAKAASAAPMGGPSQAESEKVEPIPDSTKLQTQTTPKATANPPADEATAPTTPPAKEVSTPTVPLTRDSYFASSEDVSAGWQTVVAKSAKSNSTPNRVQPILSARPPANPKAPSKKVQPTSTLSRMKSKKADKATSATRTVEAPQITTTPAKTEAKSLSKPLPPTTPALNKACSSALPQNTSVAAKLISPPKPHAPHATSKTASVAKTPDLKKDSSPALPQKTNAASKPTFSSKQHAPSISRTASTRKKPALDKESFPALPQKTTFASNLSPPSKQQSTSPSEPESAPDVVEAEPPAPQKGKKSKSSSPKPSKPAIAADAWLKEMLSEPRKSTASGDATPAKTISGDPKAAATTEMTATEMTAGASASQRSTSTTKPFNATVPVIRLEKTIHAAAGKTTMTFDTASAKPLPGGSKPAATIKTTPHPSTVLKAVKENAPIEVVDSSLETKTDLRPTLGGGKVNIEHLAATNVDGNKGSCDSEATEAKLSTDEDAPVPPMETAPIDDPVELHRIHLPASVDRDLLQRQPFRKLDLFAQYLGLIPKQLLENYPPAVVQACKTSITRLLNNPSPRFRAAVRTSLTSSIEDGYKEFFSFTEADLDHLVEPELLDAHQGRVIWFCGKYTPELDVCMVLHLLAKQMMKVDAEMSEKIAGGEKKASQEISPDLVMQTFRIKAAESGKTTMSREELEALLNESLDAARVLADVEAMGKVETRAKGGSRF